MGATPPDTKQPTERTRVHVACRVLANDRVIVDLLLERQTASTRPITGGQQQLPGLPVLAVDDFAWLMCLVCLVAASPWTLMCRWAADDYHMCRSSVALGCCLSLGGTKS